MKLKSLAILLILALAIATFSLQSLGQGGSNMDRSITYCPYGPGAVDCYPGTHFCIERECIYP